MGDEPPRKKEKFERTASSTYASPIEELAGARTSGCFSGGGPMGMRLPASTKQPRMAD
jgi:hypothetical protein